MPKFIFFPELSPEVLPGNSSQNYSVTHLEIPSEFLKILPPTSSGSISGGIRGKWLEEILKKFFGEIPGKNL